MMKGGGIWGFYTYCQDHYSSIKVDKLLFEI